MSDTMTALNEIEEELKFIANGCLVPPDGGSPTLDDAVRAAKQALTQLAALRDEMEWQDISTAPKDGTRILCWSNEMYIKPYIAWWGEDRNAPEDGNNHEEWLTGDGDDWSMGYYYTPVKPTHWKRLSGAPNNGETK